MTPEKLQKLEELAKKLVPGYHPGFKDQSSTMKFLGKLMWPFNPLFMTSFTTTFYPVVYFPSKEYYDYNSQRSFTILAHELVHLIDTKRHPFTFRLSYLFPQVLAPVVWVVYAALAGLNTWPLLVLLVGLVGFLMTNMSLLMLAVLGGLLFVGTSALLVWLTGWYSVLFFAGLVLLAPWPAPWRTYWEKRGYATSLAIQTWAEGSIQQVSRDFIKVCFVGPGYYFMSWSGRSIDRWMDRTMERARSGELAKEEPYKSLCDVLREG